MKFPRLRPAGGAPVTVRRYGAIIILEPAEPRGTGAVGVDLAAAVSVTPSFWSELAAAVDALRQRAALGTRAEAALAMVRAGIALEETIEPALGSSRLMQRQLDLARGLATDPTGIVLRGFFARLGAGTATTFMSVLRDVAARGVACYIVASNAREAELAARAVSLVFGGPPVLHRGGYLPRLGFA